MVRKFCLARADIFVFVLCDIAASAESHAQMQALDTRIEQFVSALPRLESVDPARVERSRDLLVIYTLCHCATAQLHAPLDQPLDVTTSRALTAANAAADVLRVINVARLSFVDPIMGVSVYPPRQ